MLKWLHLSDLHFNYKSYNSEQARDKMISFIKDFGCEFDFIVITGDFVFQNGNYDEVIKFIEELRNFIIPLKRKSNLFLVPGNHDLKRKNNPRDALIDSARAEINKTGGNLNYIEDEWYQNGKLDEITKNSLLQPFSDNPKSSFFEFYKKITEKDYPVDTIHFTVPMGEGVNIIHLNTCVMSNKNDKKHELIIDKHCLRNELKKSANNFINIAIGHHPLWWFEDNTKMKIEGLFYDNNIDLYLCGHIHDSEQYYNSESKFYSVACGAGVADRSKVGMIKGELDISKREGEVKYYKWSYDADNWVDDNEIRNNNNGYGNTVPLRLKKNSLPLTTNKISTISFDEFKELLSKNLAVHTLFNNKDSKIRNITNLEKVLEIKLSNSQHIEKDKLINSYYLFSEEFFRFFKELSLIDEKASKKYSCILDSYLWIASHLLCNNSDLTNSKNFDGISVHLNEVNVWVLIMSIYYKTCKQIDSEQLSEKEKKLFEPLRKRVSDFCSKYISIQQLFTRCIDNDSDVMKYEIKGSVLLFEECSEIFCRTIAVTMKVIFALSDNKKLFDFYEFSNDELNYQYINSIVKMNNNISKFQLELSFVVKSTIEKVKYKYLTDEITLLEYILEKVGIIYNTLHQYRNCLTYFLDIDKINVSISLESIINKEFTLKLNLNPEPDEGINLKKYFCHEYKELKKILEV